MQCPIFLSEFNRIWSFSTDFRKSPQYQISRKSLQLGVALIRADRQTDMKKLIGAIHDLRERA